MSTNQNAVSTPDAILIEYGEFQKRVFKMVANADVLLLDDSEIQEGTYHLQKRNYANEKTDDLAGVDDLATQLQDLNLLHPILVIEKDKRYLIVSGRKRLEAFRKTQAGKERKDRIPCKVLHSAAIFEGIKWNESTKEAQLNEALCNVSYSESAHNSPLSDETILAYLRQLRENYGHAAELFEPVMKRMGLKRENPAYRNVKRLWDVANKDALYNAVSDGLLTLGTAKADHVSKSFQDPEAAKAIVKDLKDYQRELAEDEGLSPEPLHGMKKYDHSRALKIIGQGAPAQQVEETEAYRQPDFAIEVEGTEVKVPVTSVDFNLNNRTKVAKFLEVYYALDVLITDMETALRAIKPDEAGGKAKAHSCNPSKVSPNEAYTLFIREWNMHHYAHASRVDQCAIESRGKRMVTDEELKKAKKKSAQYDLILKKFAESDKTAK